MNFNLINLFNAIIVILLLVPNIIYAFKYKDEVSLCKNKLMNILEEIGRYGSIIFMIIPLIINEFGFRSIVYLILYIFINIALLLIYLILFIIYLIKKNKDLNIILAILPAIIFLSNGILLNHYLLIFFGLIFSVAHFYVTYKNTYLS